MCHVWVILQGLCLEYSWLNIFCKSPGPSLPGLCTACPPLQKKRDEKEAASVGFRNSYALLIYLTKKKKGRGAWKNSCARQDWLESLMEIQFKGCHHITATQWHQLLEGLIHGLPVVLTVMRKYHVQWSQTSCLGSECLHTHWHLFCLIEINWNKYVSNSQTR